MKVPSNEEKGSSEVESDTNAQYESAVVCRICTAQELLGILMCSLARNKSLQGLNYN